MLKKGTKGTLSRKKGAGRTFVDLHQPAASSIKDVLKTGYLMKEGGSYKSWKSRYFVVDGNARTIYYYAKPKDKKPLGFIPLWDCKVEPNVEREYQNCFEVSHPDRRTFFMVAQSPKELNEWLDVLRKCVRDGTKARKAKVLSFWQSKFGEENSVKWPRFCDALKEYVEDSFDTLTEDRIHFVLATLALKSQPKDEVHLGQLHLFTELLGQIKGVYKNLAEVCQWYHGALTSGDAEAKLQGQPEGTYLLRLRRFAADSGLLALSVVSKKGILHTNIYKEPVAEVYYTGFNEPVFGTIQELIRAHPMCVKECEGTVARDFFKQFELARLQGNATMTKTPSAGESGGTMRGGISMPVNVQAANNNNSGQTDGETLSPRVQMAVPNNDMDSVLYLGNSVSTAPDMKTAKTDKKAPTDDHIDTFASPNGAQRIPTGSVGGPGDGAPVVVAKSGVTTFNSMHQPSATNVPDVIQEGWLICELPVPRDPGLPPLEEDEEEQYERKRCFFVLSGQMKTLYYFETPEEDRPMGFQPLWGCGVTEAEEGRGEGAFEISHPDRRSFFLQAANEVEMNDWANALLTVIEEWNQEQSRKRERFWREHFGNRKEVSWANFVDSLRGEIGVLSKRHEQQLRFMIGTFAAKNQSPDTIKSRQMYLFVELFGALSTCYRQMDKVCLWYQGSLTSGDAQSRLETQEKGTFLIRLRRFAADAGLLAMSFVDENGEVQHVNIFRDPLSECYYLEPDEPVFNSLEALVAGSKHLRPLTPPGLGRAYREFMEKLNEPILENDGLDRGGVSASSGASAGTFQFQPIEDASKTDSEDEREQQEELRREAERRKREEEEEEAERLRLEQEEQERQEQERLEQERLEQEREEQERLEQERLEQQEREEEEQRLAEQERQRQAAAADAERRRKQEEEERVRRQKEEQQRRDAEQQRKADEERVRAQKEKEAALIRQRAEMEARMQQERQLVEQEKRALALEAEKIREAEEQARLQLQREEALRRQAQEEARQQRDEAERAKQQLEQARRQRELLERQQREEAERIKQELDNAKRERELLERQQREEAEKRKLAMDEARRQREEADRIRKQKEDAEREAERSRREKQLAEREAERSRQEKDEAEERARQIAIKSDQQRATEQKKAAIEAERRALEEQRRRKLEERGGGATAAGSAPAGYTSATPPSKRAGAPAKAVPKPNNDSTVEGADLSYVEGKDLQYPEFTKGAKVERLYKERMLQARQQAEADAAAAAAAAAAAKAKRAGGGAPPPMKRVGSGVISVDPDKVREILTFLSDLEAKNQLTEDEVYHLERLVLQKDQMLLSYYVTFSSNTDMFVRKCRKHLQSLPSESGMAAPGSGSQSVIEK